MDYAKQPTTPYIYGMCENDYPNPNNLGVSIFPNTKRQTFPQELEDQFKHMQSNFSTGLFPSVSRAWMAIDSDLFLWNYETNTDLAYLDGISNTILLVELCKPRTGFSKPGLQFLLVVVTTVEILLLTLTFQDEFGITHPIDETSFKNALAFIVGEPLYKLPLEGLIVSNVRCTSSGRIFFSADDCFYELEYYDKTWYGGQTCKKVNHSKGLLSSFVPVLNIFGSKDEIRQLVLDDSRHLLYILFKKGNVQIFDLGSDGKAMQRFVTYHREQLEHDVTMMCNVTADHFKEIISVDVVPVTVSYNVYFVLTTAKGVRIYFTCLLTAITSKVTQESVRPKVVQIVQIRFPNNELSYFLKGVNVYTSLIANSTSVMASDLGTEQSNLWVFISSNFVDSPRSDEHNIVFPVQGAVWMMAKADERYFSQVVRTGPFLPPEEHPLIARQHYCRAEKFYVLTSKGVLTFLQLAPVELFRKILSKYGIESNEFNSLLSIFPKHEICIMAIIILCSDNPADVSIKDSALRVFFVYGGEPQTAVINADNDTIDDGVFRAPSRGGEVRSARTSLGWNSPAMYVDSPRTPRLSGLFSGPLRTSTPQDLQTPSPRDHTFNGPAFSTPVADETVAGSPIIVYSARHDALKLYFRRILLPVFDCNLCYMDNDQFVSSFSVDLLEQVIRYLAVYKQIIEEYSLISTSYTTHFPYSRHINDSKDTACKEQERISLCNLRNEISLTLEVLGLWSVLLEFRREDFNVVVRSLPEALQKGLVDWEFDDLLRNREDVCADLITCIVRFYIADDASTAVVSKRLRDICPSIFTMDDEQVVKATENLYRAKTTINSKDRKELIDDAIITLQQSINKLNLVQLCDLLIQIFHFEGIVDLALAKAENDDKSQLALIAYKRHITEINNVQGDAAELTDAIRRRNNAYSCITETLEILNLVAQTKNQVSTVTLNASTFLFPSADSVKELSPASAKVERDNMLARVFASDDELANVSVFRWLLERGMENILLRNDSRFFEAFLLHEIEQSKNSKYLDLLWKFNEKTGKYAEAAKILYDMAKKTGNRTTLHQRMTYLSQALVCIKTDTENKANTEFKTEIEDTLDVAQLQLRTKNTLESKPIGQCDQRRLADAVSSLNYSVFTLTELYQNFAVPFELYDIQLDVLHCAGHYEKDVVEKIWSHMIQQELAKFFSKTEDEAAAQARLGGLLLKMRKRFVRSLQYIPYSFILKQLLTEGLKKSVSTEWLPNICKTGEVPYNLLLEVIDYEFRIGDPFWRQNPRALQFITGIVVVVSQRFKIEHHRLPLTEKKVFREACLNALAQLTLDLQNRNKRSEVMELLQEELKKMI